LWIGEVNFLPAYVEDQKLAGEHVSSQYAVDARQGA
jgi:hypothetical protein